VTTPGPNLGLVIAGGAVTLAGLAAGIGLLVASGDKRADAVSLREDLLKQGIKVCAPGSSVEDCQRFVAAGNARVLLGNLGGSLLVGAGLIGVGTAIYYFVARPRKTTPPLAAGVAVGPDGAAFSFGGNF
jgi:hypothetical protein